MRPSGLDAVSRAEADGTWQAAYEGQAAIEVPPDLAAALAREPSASTMFDGLSRSDRYTVLYRVTTARRPDTRRRRIEEFVAMLARGGAPHAQRGAALGTRPPGARAGRAEEAEGPTAPAGGGRSAPGAR